MSKIGIGVLLSLLFAATAIAQRDPTMPPPEALVRSDGSGVVSSDIAAKVGLAVVVRDGKPFLVEGTRLYGVGQTVGANRIVKITETEVWLRNGKDLRKVPRFAGIQRKPAQPATGTNP